MGRSEMEDMLVGRVCQEGTPLLTRLQEGRQEGNIAQLGYNPTDIETPMDVEIIQDPVKSLDLGEPPGHVTQVGREVHAGSSRPQIADDLTGRYDQGGDQSSRPIADIVLLTSCGLAGLSRLRGMGTAQGLHSRLFITANNQSSLLVHRGRSSIQLTDRLSLGVEVRVVAVEPVNAPMWFQIGFVKGPPDRGPTHRCGMSRLVDQGGS